MHLVGVANLHLSSDEEAASWLRRAVEANRNNPITHFDHAAALALLADEARSAVQAGLALDPTFTTAYDGKAVVTVGEESPKRWTLKP